MTITTKELAEKIWEAISIAPFLSLEGKNNNRNWLDKILEQFERSIKENRDKESREISEFSTEDLSEALIRHLEIVGAEVLHKSHMTGDRVDAAVWCFVGSNVDEINKAIVEYLQSNGFKED